MVQRERKNNPPQKNYFGMILQNITRRSFRSALMIFLLAILSFSVFSSSMILKSLELGITSTAEKAGADIAIVPDGYVSELQNALFTGVPCTVYFDREWVGRIRAVKGVGRISHQLYLSTITDSDCCDKDLQVIAFDPDSDFVVQPWINRTLGGSLSKNQIAVGYNLKYVPGDTAKFYGEQFTVAAKLEKTGMGYDNTVFMTYETAYDLVQKPVVRNFFSIGNRKNLVSMIAAEVGEGYTAQAVAENIKKLYGEEGISVYTSENLLGRITDNLKNLTAYSSLFNGLLLVSTIFTLFFVFTITANERKREFGILRTLGAVRIQLIVLIAGEAGIISAAGSLAGSLAAWYLTSVFQNYIVNTLKVPFLQPHFPLIALTAGKCILVTMAAGLAASVYSVLKVGFAESQALLRENEI